jgi:hypothetical protein
MRETATRIDLNSSIPVENRDHRRGNQGDDDGSGREPPFREGHEIVRGAQVIRITTDSGAATKEPFSLFLFERPADPAFLVDFDLEIRPSVRCVADCRDSGVAACIENVAAADGKVPDDEHRNREPAYYEIQHGIAGTAFAHGLFSALMCVCAVSPRGEINGLQPAMTARFPDDRLK